MDTSRLVLALVCALLATPLVCRPVWACETDTYYLDPAGGNDANDCAAPETACQSAAKLQTLLNQLQAGQAVLLKRGTTLVLTKTLLLDKHSGTDEAPITLGAYGDTQAPLPHLDSTTMAGGAMQIQCKKVGHWRLQDLQFTARKGAVAFASCAHSVLERAHITRCDQECVRIYRADAQSFSAFITLRDVTITAPNRTEAIYIGTDPQQAGETTPDLTQDIRLERMDISGGRGECIEMKAGSQRVTIVESTFHDLDIGSGANGCIFSARSASAPAGNHVIRNNTLTRISGVNGYGIRVRNDATIEGNTVSETSQPGIFLEQLSGNPTYKRVLSIKTATK